MTPRSSRGSARHGSAKDKPGFFNYPRKQKTGWKRWLPSWKFVTASFLALILLTGSLFAAAYAMIDIPDPDDFAQAETTKVYYSDGTTQMGEFKEENREIIDTSKLPSYVGEAIVAAEDRTFWDNSGIDPVGMARAVFNNFRGRPMQGASTITQQYIERYFVGQTTTDPVGKMREAILALKVTRSQDKERILGNYMNTIYFGRGSYGIETAAQSFFGKPAKDLSLSESALLAGIIPSPENFDPAVAPDKTRKRWNYVLDGMVKTKAISQAERSAQTFPKVKEKRLTNELGGPQGYLVEMVRQELVDSKTLTEDQLRRGGYRIVTTIDPKMQQAAVDAQQAIPEDAPADLMVPLVAMDPKTGGIKALIGGRDYVKKQFNWATDGRGSAGSTFKPFALTAALEEGIGLQTSYSGASPMTLRQKDGGPDWRVSNSGNQSFGVVSLVQATAHSVNTAYAQLSLEIGGDKTAKAAVKAGIPKDKGTGLNNEPSNVLGTATPHAVDLVTAYATFAAQGVHHDWYIVQSLTDSDGKKIYTGQHAGKTVFAKDVMADVTYTLQQVADYGTASGARAALGRPVAAKTGTAEDNVAAWTIGFTPNLVATVGMFRDVDAEGKIQPLGQWGGYSEIFGGTAPKKVWEAFMVKAIKDLPVEGFPQPAWKGKAAQNSVPQRRQPERIEPTAEPQQPSEPSEQPAPTAPVQPADPGTNPGTGGGNGGETGGGNGNTGGNGSSGGPGGGTDPGNGGGTDPGGTGGGTDGGGMGGGKSG